MKRSKVHSLHALISPIRCDFTHLTVDVEAFSRWFPALHLFGIGIRLVKCFQSRVSRECKYNLQVLKAIALKLYCVGLCYLIS